MARAICTQRCIKTPPSTGSGGAKNAQSGWRAFSRTSTRRRVCGGTQAPTLQFCRNYRRAQTGRCHSIIPSRRKDRKHPCSRGLSRSTSLAQSSCLSDVHYFGNHPSGWGFRSRIGQYGIQRYHRSLQSLAPWRCSLPLPSRRRPWRPRQRRDMRSLTFNSPGAALVFASDHWALASPEGRAPITAVRRGVVAPRDIISGHMVVVAGPTNLVRAVGARRFTACALEASEICFVPPLP
jgi:hypothetical protein